MTHQMHLNKSGSGMASRTACGRNILRTPMSLAWAGFKLTPRDQQCELCACSKYAAVNTKSDERKAFGDWEPVDNPDAWKAQDDALLAAYRAKRAA